jgi:hypothetical protein
MLTAANTTSAYIHYVFFPFFQFNLFASQAAQQVAIAHDGTVPNNPDSIPILINLFLQQFIIATTNIFPTINALAFADPVGEFFHENFT